MSKRIYKNFSFDPKSSQIDEYIKELIEFREKNKEFDDMSIYITPISEDEAVYEISGYRDEKPFEEVDRLAAERETQKTYEENELRQLNRLATKYNKQIVDLENVDNK